MDGRKLLSDYIERETTQAKLARASGCSEGHLCLYLQGKRQFSIALALRISAATRGAVPVSVLVPDRMAEAAELLGAAE